MALAETRDLHEKQKIVGDEACSWVDLGHGLAVEKDLAGPGVDIDMLVEGCGVHVSISISDIDCRGGTYSA